MSIEKQYGFYIVRCDNCTEADESDATTKQEAIIRAKENGYRCVKCGDEWSNYCPECSEAQ